MKLREICSMRNPFFISIFLFLFTVASRIPFTSKFLYHLDSGNFALALDQYDIGIHQPHPPGYFLYVMLGRFVHLFVEDANLVFVIISIIFSGLTIVTVFHLTKEMFDEKTAMLASALSFTSPSLWFHGEIALSYAVEALFSTLIAYYCWKIYKGEQKYLWLSVIVLAFAGGIRQNTAVFLFPIWLFSVRNVPVKRVFSAFLLLIIICLTWFLPMIILTGGWHAYLSAFKELWVFNTGKYTVFEKGIDPLITYSVTVGLFVIYGLGSGIMVLFLGIYSVFRKGCFLKFDRSKISFLTLWILPSLLFYILIFIHPANPGYILIVLPALIILTAVAIFHLEEHFAQLIQRNLFIPITAVIIGINVSAFLFMNIPVSYREIKNHDQEIIQLVDGIKAFNPMTTAIFTGPYIFLGYRQIMYYLPDYQVYQIDVRQSGGEDRRIFWGNNRETHISDKIVLPKAFEMCVKVMFGEGANKDPEGLSVKELSPNLYLISGPKEKIHDILNQ